MKQSTDLYELIHSMNKNEKRYFAMNSEFQKGDKIYLRLFKAVENQKMYDETKLRSIYKNEKFIKNLAFNKNNLYILIMKSLINYNSSKNIDSRIHMMISECYILFRKAMYRKYFRTIAKAKLIAKKYERHGYLIQLLDMEKIIIPKEEIQTQKSEEIFSEVKETAAKIVNMFEYSRLAGNLLNNYRSIGLNRTDIHRESIENLSGIEIMDTPDNAKSMRALDSFYRVKELSATAKANNTEAYNYLQKRYEIVKNNPDPFRDYIIHYPSDILYSLTEASINLNKLDEAEKYLNEIMLITNKYPAELDDIEIYSGYARIRIYLKRGMVQQASKLIPHLEKLLIKYKNKILIDIELSIRFYIVKCRFEEKNFTKALKAVNELMIHPLLNKRSDYECYVKIINLIIHFELKNFELLKHLLVNTYRYLIKNERTFKVELLILEFIRKLSKVNSEDDLKFIFIQMGKKLTILKKDKYEKNAFEYFDFLKWVNNKLDI